ncbi:Sugar transporter [Penicillium malachiteum]|nr:Sugar transporter [Penicillium malachiteum]
MSEPSKIFQPQLSVPERPQAAEESTTSTRDEADQTYNAKAQVLNRAIQEIGMDRYQWQLFVVIGFGWASDNLWPIVTSLILAPVAYEFQIGKESLAQNIGLLIGAIFWGFGCDIFGRTWGFNLTIGVTAVFAMVAAGSPNFAAICVFAALWSIGVGGNIPVDSAIFLEFLPGSHQYLLTVLSIDWAVAQVLANLVAWPLLGDMTCSSHAHGQNEQAVRVVHEVARRNGKTSTLSQDELDEFQQGYNQRQRTTLIILVWAFIGLGYPLYNAFIPCITVQRGASYGDGSIYLTYRNSLIVAVMGVPGCLLGGVLVEIPRLGRKGALSSSTVLTGAFLLVSTAASSSNALLGWNCAFNFMSSLMYAVLYAYTPEIFLTKDRGTGNALTASANRIFGIMSPIIAMFANLETAVPVYVSGALFISAGILATLMPYESRGKASL